jgi:hypothetical protein
MYCRGFATRTYIVEKRTKRLWKRLVRALCELQNAIFLPHISAPEKYALYILGAF